MGSHLVLAEGTVPGRWDGSPLRNESQMQVKNIPSQDKSERLVLSPVGRGSGAHFVRYGRVRRTAARRAR
jgi:hypothetical protein